MELDVQFFQLLKNIRLKLWSRFGYINLSRLGGFKGFLVLTTTSTIIEDRRVTMTQIAIGVSVGKSTSTIIVVSIVTMTLVITRFLV